MNYGRDYGNRNFLERAAHTVRGWIGRGGGDDRFYDDEYRGGMNRGWDADRGYREMGDVSGYGGGYDRGYAGANWRGRNPDWNRGSGDSWNRGMGGGGWGGGGGGYRTGGYNADHGAWDVDWDQGRSGGYGARGGPDRGYGGGYGSGGYSGGGYGGGGYGGGGDDRDHYMGRDFMTNHPHFGHDWRSGHSDDATVDMNRGGGDWNRMGGGMRSRGMQGGMDRGMDRDTGGDWDRGGYGGAGMLGGDADVGDVSGGMIGNYGAYGNYGIERFRSGSGGGVPSGQYYRGYGVGSGYR
ncbi:MAG: hypothetical protein KY467_05005 [Gemmatimonadetes bacterium]|nr:hypothetical protein [Gemmatimonadota bacterium]